MAEHEAAVAVKEAAGNQDTTDKVLGVLQALGNEIGETVDYAWPELVKYTFAEGLTPLILYGFALLFTGGLMVYFWVRFTRWQREIRDGDRRPSDGEEVGYWLPWVVCAVIFLIAFPVSVNAFHHNLPKVLAPEGATVMKVIDRLESRERRRGG